MPEPVTCQASRDLYLQVGEQLGWSKPGFISSVRGTEARRQHLRRPCRRDGISWTPIA